jgi:tetratricopeptide (TPR) repeat protein
MRRHWPTSAALSSSDPADDWEHYSLSLVYICRSEPEEAGSHLTAAIDLALTAVNSAENSGRGEFNLAVYLAARGAYEQAHITLRSAVKRSPFLYLIREAADDLRDLGGVAGISALEITRLLEVLSPNPPRRSTERADEA